MTCWDFFRIRPQTGIRRLLFYLGELLAQFAGGEVGNVDDLPLHSQFCARGLNEVLDRIGKSVVLTYAAGSFFGWQLANDRP